MNFFSRVLIAASAIAVCATGCKEDSGTLGTSGAEYVMFADTLGVYPVIENGTFTVPVVSTVARKYDRTFAVEVIDKGSNAIENRHFRLKSNTIVIPAGEVRTDVEVEGIFENIEADDSLGFTMRLVMPSELEMPVYGTDEKYGVETKCVLMKTCPFDINNFCGYCMLTSTYLLNYSLNGSYQRLIWTEPHKSLENTIVCHDWLYDGYDINLTLDPDDPMSPEVIVEKDQVISDEWTAFGIIRGDNKIRVENSPAYPAFFYGCQNYLTTSFRVYVTKLGGEYGTVGHFYNVMEWISDEEADRLMREEGMTMATRPSGKSGNGKSN
ncbi:MAG: DUF4984 domain-containing protein [Bacteroidales bacterium]|nr:DUF4984 domain-containing protein [Bacteroides sp.]MCM1198840.1 DUF4984 domain-containing protein [Clostridium sp.]MCM1503245.1 DUF4984 domain-containing protein [Bacteroidales bacterium]